MLRFWVALSALAFCNTTHASFDVRARVTTCVANAFKRLMRNEQVLLETKASNPVLLTRPFDAFVAGESTPQQNRKALANIARPFHQETQKPLNAMRRLAKNPRSPKDDSKPMTEATINRAVMTLAKNPDTSSQLIFRLTPGSGILKQVNSKFGYIAGDHLISILRGISRHTLESATKEQQAASAFHGSAGLDSMGMIALLTPQQAREFLQKLHGEVNGLQTLVQQATDGNRKPLLEMLQTTQGIPEPTAQEQIESLLRIHADGIPFAAAVSGRYLNGHEPVLQEGLTGLDVIRETDRLIRDQIETEKNGYNRAALRYLDPDTGKYKVWFSKLGLSGVIPAEVRRAPEATTLVPTPPVLTHARRPIISDDVYTEAATEGRPLFTDLDSRDALLQRARRFATRDPSKLHRLIRQLETNPRPEFKKIGAELLTRFANQPEITGLLEHFQTTPRVKSLKPIAAFNGIDEMTGLLNPTAGKALIERQLLQAAERSEKIAFAMSDGDNFKRFNDTFGRDAGDDLIRVYGDVFRYLKTLYEERVDANIVRLGGEEFLTQFTAKPDGEALEPVQREFLQSFQDLLSNTGPHREGFTHLMEETNPRGLELLEKTQARWAEVNGGSGRPSASMASFLADAKQIKALVKASKNKPMDLMNRIAENLLHIVKENPALKGSTMHLAAPPQELIEQLAAGNETTPELLNEKIHKALKAAYPTLPEQIRGRR